MLARFFYYSFCWSILIFIMIGFDNTTQTSFTNTMTGRLTSFDKKLHGVIRGKIVIDLKFLDVFFLDTLKMQDQETPFLYCLCLSGKYVRQTGLHLYAMCKKWRPFYRVLRKKYNILTKLCNSSSLSKNVLFFVCL